MEKSASRLQPKAGSYVRQRRALSSALLLTRRRLGPRAARVEIVPIQDRIEAEEVRPLGLPSPERPIRKHDDMSLAKRRIDDHRFVGQRLRVVQQPRQQ